MQINQLSLSMNTIASNIEAIRKKVGVKQEDLAKRLGVSQGTYSGYLTQNQDIKYGLILEIANKLGVPVVDIITYPDEYVVKSNQFAIETTFGASQNRRSQNCASWGQ